MAEKDEQLAIDIIAKLNNLEKQMAKASGITARAYREMSLGSKKATKQMENDAVRSASRINQAMATISSKVGDYSKAFGAGLIGGITAGGVAGITAAVKGAAASFAELGREAKTAGINVEDFQRWRYVADQNKIGIDALIDGFKELNLRADEYIQTGKGSAAESFQRLGMSPDEVKERIKDPSAFMLELIDRTRRLKDTAAGIRIFDELLGGSGGEQFVRLIEQGRDGITDTLNEATKMGVVLDESFIKRADEIDKAFNRISGTVGTALKGAIVDAATALGNFISQFNEMQEKSQSGISAELEMLNIRKAQLEKQKGSGEDWVLSYIGKDAETELKAVNGEITKLNDELERRKSIRITEDKAAPPVTPYVPPSTKKAGKSSADREREKAAREADRERKAVEALIAELEFEASLVGKSVLEKEKLTAVRQAGASATDVEKQKIEGLVESIYQQNEAFDAAQQRLADINDAAREATGTLVSGLLNGKSGAESLADALSGVADRLLNDVLDSIFKVNQAGGGGIFGSLLGGLFGGGGGGFGANFFPSAPRLGGGIGMYARGTDFAPGGAAIVGEQGPELLKLPRGAQVTPNHQLAQAMNGGGQSSTQQNVHVTVGVSVDKSGNLQAYVLDVAKTTADKSTQQGIEQFSKSQHFSNVTARALQNAQKRGMLR